MTQSNRLTGVLFATFSMLCFSVTYALYKSCSPLLSTAQIIFFQSSLSWCLILPFAFRKGVRELIVSPLFFKIILRSLFGLLGLYCITDALKTTGLAQVVLLNNSAPLFVPLILLIWHRIHISKQLWLSLLIGFVGVFLVLRPSAVGTDQGLLLAALSGLFSALLLVVASQIAQEPFLRILFYYYSLFWILLLPFIFTPFEMPPKAIWIALGAAALTNIAAQVSITAAVRRATSQEIAPFIYTSVVFSGLIGWLFWAETPSLLSLIGMAVVCVGGVSSIIFTKRKG